nr:hypothetical protein CFP56_22579 [Quercus suber]
MPSHVRPIIFGNGKTLCSKCVVIPTELGVGPGDNVTSTRLHLPEGCVYDLQIAARSPHGDQPACSRTSSQRLKQPPLVEVGSDTVLTSNDRERHSDGQQIALVQSFGYFDGSELNTLALLKTVGRSCAENKTDQLLSRVDDPKGQFHDD